MVAGVQSGGQGIMIWECFGGIGGNDIGFHANL